MRHTPGRTQDQGVSDWLLLGTPEAGANWRVEGAHLGDSVPDPPRSSPGLALWLAAVMVGLGLRIGDVGARIKYGGEGVQWVRLWFSECLPEKPCAVLSPGLLEQKGR